MPPIGSVSGVEWYNQNALRKFPLTDTATSKDITGTFELPNDLLVDLIIPVPSASSYDPSGFYLSEVSVFGQGVVLAFSYTDGVTPVEIARLSVSKTHVKNASYFINGVGAYSDVVGRATIGVLDSILNFGGVYQFDLSGGRLIPTVIRPDIRGVTSLRVRNGGETSNPLYGDIELVAGSNVLLEVDTGGGNNNIIINAINGNNLDAACECLADADRPLPGCIRTINGVPAASNGNFQISTVGCIAATALTNGIKLEDTCSKPCCTSSELQTIVNAMTTLSNDVRSQGFTMKQLETRILQLSALQDAIGATGFII